VNPNDPAFDSWIRELNPDYVIFDRFIIEEQFGWRVQETVPHAIRILDTVDLHFLRRGRLKALNDKKTLEEIAHCKFELISEDALRELGSIYRSDCALIISSFEMNLLTDVLNISKERLFLSRLFYQDLTSSPLFDEREGFVIIGNFRHAPNSDGVRWFRREIWPLIRKQLPLAQVYIYGAYPTKEMMSLSQSDSGFHVLGSTPNQFHALKKHRVNLAPIRFGAGIKGKISDGWWSGTPVVATQVAAEGMNDNLPWGGEISNSPELFAHHAVTLYTQQNIWQLAQERGFELIRKLYTSDPHSKDLMNHLLAIKIDIHSIRKNNLIGAILNHDLHRSTKYFSKWIEEKNKVLT
jgi:hypothetical protein